MIVDGQMKDLSPVDMASEILSIVGDRPVLYLGAKSILETRVLSDVYDENDLKKCDILLLRTGFWEHRNEEIYRLANPGVTPEAANYIREFENINSNRKQLHQKILAYSFIVPPSTNN